MHTNLVLGAQAPEEPDRMIAEGNLELFLATCDLVLTRGELYAIKTFADPEGSGTWVQTAIGYAHYIGREGTLLHFRDGTDTRTIGTSWETTYRPSGRSLTIRNRNDQPPYVVQHEIRPVYTENPGDEHI